MATVFMQWLETSPKKYDLGIKLLTLGHLRRVKEEIVNRYIQPGMRILEIGCGTGTLAVMMAQKGALIEGVDNNAAMLSEAYEKIAARGLEESIHLSKLDASEIGDHFPVASFDLVISTLVLSELDDNQQAYLLEQSKKLLKPDGRIIIADEVVPEKSLSRLLFYIIRLPIALLTWFLTRTSTSPLRKREIQSNEAGLSTRQVFDALLGS